MSNAKSSKFVKSADIQTITNKTQAQSCQMKEDIQEQQSCYLKENLLSLKQSGYVCFGQTFLNIFHLFFF